MGIQGYISLMRLQTSPQDPNAEYVQGIENAVKNAANLTSQLLGFARKGKYALKQTCINDLVVFLLPKTLVKAPVSAWPRPTGS